MTHLLTFLEIFRFIKRYRERESARLNTQLAREAAERAHQLAMLQTIFEQMAEFAKANNTGLLKMAEAQVAQSEVMATWLKGFQVSDPTPLAPQVVRDEDEWLKENQREILSNLPPEFAMAFKLKAFEDLNAESSDPGEFDREGSDFPLT